MSAKQAICLKYLIKGLREEPFCYQEFFVPYSGEEIKNSPFFEEIADCRDLINDSVEYNLDFISREYTETVDEEKILPNTANILMDAAYCATEYVLYEEDPYVWTHPFLFWDVSYIGLYTELIKYEIAEIKYLISVLINLYSVSNDENELKVRAVFDKIKQRFSLNVSGETPAENRGTVKL